MIHDEVHIPQGPLSEEQDLAWETPEDVPKIAPPQVSLYHTSHDLFQAHSALLDHVVISLEAYPDLYRLIRMHLTTLQRWHEEHTGWRIQNKPTFFRLERHPHSLTPLALDEKLKRPRDFVCFTLLLWFAEKRYLTGGERNQQFLLSQLAEALKGQSQELGSGSPLDFRSQQDRYSLVRALDYLIQVGGLRELEGEAKRWADSFEQEEVEVLYEFTTVSHSLIEALNEEQVEALTRLVSVQQERLLPQGTLSAVAQGFPPLLRIWRTLLLGPALLRYDDPEAFTILFQQAQHIQDLLTRTFGWSLELNDHYACVVRGGNPAGPTLTSNGAYHQMILLLCTRFRQQVEQQIWPPDQYGCLTVSHWEILPLFHELRQQFGVFWGASVKESKAEELLEEVYRQMRLFGLLRGPDAERQLLILPTAARYCVSYQQDQPEGRSAASNRTRKTSKHSNEAAPLELGWDVSQQDASGES